MRSKIKIMLSVLPVLFAVPSMGYVQAEEVVNVVTEEFSECDVMFEESTGTEDFSIVPEETEELSAEQQEVQNVIASEDDLFIEEIEDVSELFSGNEMTVEQKVAKIAAECVASGMKTDYEKAVWLHDWLVYHANYDYTYTEYEADGVLLKGTGVCESYTRAYGMLLDYFGIENELIIAFEMDHSWNLVKLNGEYCHVDCTWDDPGTGGEENYAYFGMNDELMAMDHQWNRSEHPASRSLKNYYPIRCGYEVITNRTELWAYLDRSAGAQKSDLEVYYAGSDQNFNLVNEFKSWYDRSSWKYGLSNFAVDANERMINISMEYPDFRYTGNKKELETKIREMLNKKEESITIYDASWKGRWENWNYTSLLNKIQPILAKYHSCTTNCSEIYFNEEILTVTLAPEYGTHEFGAYKVTKDATVFAPGVKTRFCKHCSVAEKTELPKLKVSMTLNVSSLSLKTKQKAPAIKVTGLAKGDAVASYISDNPKIFTVSSTGVVTAKNVAGSAKLTIRLKSGYTKTIDVKVQKAEIKTKKISNVAKKLNLKKGKKYSLKPVITPANATDKLTFTTSNKKIATVSSKGVITAKKKGTAKITVKSGSKKVVCTVKVKN